MLPSFGGTCFLSCLVSDLVLVIDNNVSHVVRYAASRCSVSCRRDGPPCQM